jgi:hypothetical protein
MALDSPPVWPPVADADLGRFRFIIDVCEPETKDVLLELFSKHILVQSFFCLHEVDLDRIAEEAPKQATFVITDDVCRPICAVASASATAASSSLHSQPSLALAFLARATAAHNQIKSVRSVQLAH